MSIFTEGEKMADNKFLEYKGKPLVRKGNEIYYGNMAEPYVVRFEILAYSKGNDIESASEVSVQLLKSDTELPAKDRVVKKTVKSTMFDALDFGFTWLEMALKEAK